MSISKQKIGIFAPWGKGDLIISTSVLHYRNRLWPNSKIIWFASKNNIEILEGHPEIDEIRIWPFEFENVDIPWLKARGERHGDLTSEKEKFEQIKDLDLGFFSVPWLSRNAASELALVPKNVFGISTEEEWKPYIYLKNEEIEEAKKFVNKLPNKFSIMLETKCISGQSSWNDNDTLATLKICQEILGNCNFIFASPGSHFNYTSQYTACDCSGLKFRQCLAIYNLIDLFIGISSGISCLTCSKGANKKVERIEFCGAYTVSCKPICPEETLTTSHNDYYAELRKALLRIKNKK